eukprot:GEMP01060009.1.p1 GENE.GEMP01060009.1~~GEMP01060009.1.p1  ORF type:complete len:370 (+),score=51.18 GEMP01060009.1:212-1321(+)
MMLLMTNNTEIHNIDLHSEPRTGVPLYFSSHKNLCGLHATTSCYSIWHDNGNTNGFAKVIPAPPKGDNYFVFFFDDNIEFHGGLQSSRGITNLREANTGEFVTFAEGQNGFAKPLRVGQNTQISPSTEYNAVLVKVNILDAMQNVRYFTDIVERYAPPGSKIVAYVDVNSTVVFGDVMTGKGKHAVVLSMMYESITLQNTNAFTISWGENVTITVNPGFRSLKNLAKEVSGGTGPAYKEFWTLETCVPFMLLVMEHVTISCGEQQMDATLFRKMYKEYVGAMENAVSKTGIVESWYSLCEELRRDHLIMLNTFGVDSRFVLRHTLEKFHEDEHQAILTAVNYERWSTADMLAFEQQYQDKFREMLNPPD